MVIGGLDAIKCLVSHLTSPNSLFSKQPLDFHVDLPMEENELIVGILRISDPCDKDFSRHPKCGFG